MGTPRVAGAAARAGPVRGAPGLIRPGRSAHCAGRGRRPNSYAISSAFSERIRAALEGQQASLQLVTHIEVAQKPVFAANVVGMIEGVDPDLRAEIVGIGSHLDHIGARGDVINNGADDDGSGTTGVLAVARAFALNPTKPRRSVLFMCFAGEEMGLIGSRYYTDNPIMPLENMVCLLQMDMVGRNEETQNDKPEDNVNTIHLIGSKRISMELHNITIEANRHIGFEFEYDEEDVYTRSDHYNFARQGIPVVFFCDGEHPDYHQVTDHADKLDHAKMELITRLAYWVGFSAADAKERPRALGSQPGW